MITKPVLIFDFGGVLLDWNPHNLFLEFFCGDIRAVENFLTEIDFYAWNLEQDKGRSFQDGVAELSARFPQYAHLIRAFDERWVESISGPIDSTVNALQPLKDSGYRLFGLTNWSGEKFQLVRHKYDFFRFFEFILVSGVVKLAKPDARIFRMILEHIDRPANECILIDDSAINIAAAQHLGFQTIHFTSSMQMLAELEKLGVLQDRNL